MYEKEVKTLKSDIDYLTVENNNLRKEIEKLRDALQGRRIATFYNILSV